MSDTFDDFQIEHLVINPATGNGWTVDHLGYGQQLSPKGKATMRRTWEAEPERRHLFPEEPPASWAAPPANDPGPTPDLDVPPETVTGSSYTPPKTESLPF